MPLPQPAVAQLEDLVVRLSSLTARRDGFSRTAAATLNRLAGSDPTRLTELAVAGGVSQPSMSALIGRLVDQGLVHRGTDPLDARVVLLSLTPAGDQLVAQRRADRTDRLTRALADLPEDDAVQITETLPALSRLADALRRSQTLREVIR